MSITVEDIELNVRSLIAKEGFSKDIFKRFNHLLGEVWETSKEVNELFNCGNDKSLEAEVIREKLGKELYDVIWNAIALAQVSGVDIKKSINLKIKTNKKRFKGKVKHLKEVNSYGFIVEGFTRCGLNKVSNAVSCKELVSCINCLKTMDKDL